jgi:hypothetical protein
LPRSAAFLGQNGNHAPEGLPVPKPRFTFADPQDRCFALTALVLVLAILFGGGTTAGLPGDAFVQIVSLPLLGFAAMQLWRVPPSRHAQWLLFLLLAVVALIVIQLIPLPYALWQHLPGRGGIVRDLAIAGIPPVAMPLSLAPAATEGALWSLIPGVAVLLGTLAVSSRQRRWLVIVLIIAAGVSALVGFAQVAAPPGALRIYEYTHKTDAVGFFANRNHEAALLYTSLVLAIAWFAGMLKERITLFDNVPTGRLVLAAVLCVVLMIGLILARSRAGVAMGMLGILASAAVVWRQRAASERGAIGTRFVVVTAVAGILIALQLGLWQVMNRFDTDPLEDARWIFLSVTMKAADHFGPLGSGFGSFIHAYQAFETPDVTQTFFVNQAHDDWAQLWLEGGWPAALLIGAFLVWFGVCAWSVWRRDARSSPVSIAFSRAAAIGIALLLIHAFVDYALRTTAIMAVFGLLLALLAGGLRAPPPPRPIKPVLRPVH